MPHNKVLDIQQKLTKMLISFNITVNDLFINVYDNHGISSTFSKRVVFSLKLTLFWSAHSRK